MLKDCIIYKGRIIEYEWTKTKRKTVGISIDGEGKLTVRAPYGSTREQVIKCLEDHISWILKNLDKKKPAPSSDGHPAGKKEDEYYYLGKNYRLRTEKDISIGGEDRAKIHLSDSTGEIVLFYNGPVWTKEEIKGVMEQWYREKARAYLTKRSEHYCRRIGVTYGSIRIKNQKTRWGSCSSLGNINYNWRIIMAPPEVVDYLVVHELCHRKEMNHSVAFWRLVEQQLPDYMDRKKWLTENARLLSW